jgi:hypothetical protein
MAHHVCAEHALGTYQEYAHVISLEIISIRNASFD